MNFSSGRSRSVGRDVVQERDGLVQKSDHLFYLFSNHDLSWLKRSHIRETTSMYGHLRIGASKPINYRAPRPARSYRAGEARLAGAACRDCHSGRKRQRGGVFPGLARFQIFLAGTPFITEDPARARSGD